MNQFFGTHFSQEDLQQRLAQRRRNGAARTSSMSMGPPAPQHNQSTMDTGGMMGGDSLDDIIMQNNKELQRRQSYPHPYGEDMNGDDTRRSSMMEFGSRNNGLGDFQFGTSTSSVGDGHLRRQSSGEIEMVGGYSDINGDMGADMLPGQMQFTSGMQTTEPLTIESGFHSMSPDMVQGMMGYGSMGIGMEGLSDGEPTPMMFAPGNFSFTEPMSSDYLMAPTEHDGLPPTLQNQESDEMMPAAPGLSITDTSLLNSPNTNMGQRSTSFGSPATTKMSPFPNQDTYNISGSASQAPLPEPTPVATPVAPPPPPPPPPPKEPKIRDQFQDVYSSSGFDMLKALNKVASRPNPEINIGAVDLSCAFVVCDILQNDCPIIYVSDIFERLTGYNKHEVLGRNCRFLQSPHGKVQAGVKRTYVDDDTVHYIKDRLSRNSEVQRSLINYRKGGQPFMNLLTMIPIPWDTDEIRYFVGFQVDLVEQPGSVAGKGSGGSYNVNYQQRSPPKYIWQPPESARPGADAGQTISRDDVSAVLTSFNNSGESELTKRMWDKVLLENTDDVVHVLSLKGLFLYLSPSSKKVLEYDSSELVGTALSSICHPSDIVPVTRELKDTSTGSAVSVVFRIRRKNSGYTWFESHGALCVEQGKGRKCIILVGRERPVYAISKLDIEAVGGIGENELWTKLSTSGMFLFVSSNVRALIDRQPEELIGTSIQSIMRPESKIEFGRSLEKARTGKRISFKHEVLNKRGLVLQAQTNLYPGDAAEGSKPTFLVAQTRFLKATSRTNGPASNSSSGHSYAREFGEVHSPRSITGPITEAGGSGLAIGSQDVALASDNNIFDELKTTRCTSWQFELRQMEKSNRLLAEELASLLSNKKKRKRRKGAGHLQRDCANCHTRTTPEWRRGPSGQRDLCNSCGLRYAKQTGRVSPRTSTRGGDAASKVSTDSPAHKSPLRKEVQQQSTSSSPSINLRPNPTTSAADSGSSASSTATVLPTTATGVPASLGGRTTTECQPIHTPSVGFKEGGERGITKIVEENGSVS